METIHIDKLVRSRRKSIGIIVENDGSLIVRAPFYVSMSAINDFIEEKRSWIIKHKQKAIEKFADKKPKEFIQGEEFLYLGRIYPLIITKKVRIPLHIDLFNFILREKDIKNALDIFTEWYKDRAYGIIFHKLKTFSDNYGFNFKKLTINDAKKRWGSCSSSGNINFSWRVVQAPEDVIDYLVVHELAHTKHLNHSRTFWDLVESVLPDYKEKEKWLNDNGHLLDF